MNKDDPQSVVLAGMLVLLLLMVGAVFLEGWWKNLVDAPPPRTSEGPVRRVSLLPATQDDGEAIFDSSFVLARPLELARIAPVNRFDQPMGTEHGALTYNAQPFGENHHLGDDLNGIGGWDSDLGDPVFAVAGGRVLYAAEPSEGWGNLVIVGHRLPGGHFVQTVYAHLDRIDVAVDGRLTRGEMIGTVGKGGARQYLAHLHFEVRRSLALNPGAGYAKGPLNRVSPAAFLEARRGAPDGQLIPAPERDPVAAREVERVESFEVEMRPK